MANACAQFKVTTPGPSLASWQITCFTRLLSRGCAPSCRRRCQASRGKSRASSTTRVCGAWRRVAAPSATSPAYAQSSRLALLHSSRARVTRSPSERDALWRCTCPHNGQQTRPWVLRRGEACECVCCNARAHGCMDPQDLMVLYDVRAPLPRTCYATVCCGIRAFQSPTAKPTGPELKVLLLPV